MCWPIQKNGAYFYAEAYAIRNSKHHIICGSATFGTIYSKYFYQSYETREIHQSCCLTCPALKS